VQKRNIIVKNIIFFNNVILIYLLIFLFVSLTFTTSFITETISADSSNYYVSNSGDDSWNGLYPTYQGGVNGPWRTIQYAVTKVSPGDTVYILAGTYVERVNPYYGSGMKSGSASSIITYKPYGDGEVIIDATGGSINSLYASAFWSESVHHFRLTNLTFRNSMTYLVAIENGNNIIVDNCTFYNCSASAIYSINCQNLKFENNTISYAQTGYGYETVPPNEVLTLLNVDGFEVCYNNIFMSSKLCIDAKSGSSLGSIHNNRINTTAPWVFGWSVGGIYIDAGDTSCYNISIFNNIIFGNSTGYVIGGEAGGDCINIYFYNNIYNGTGHAFQINSFPGDDLKINCVYINNIVSGASYCFFITDINASYTNFTVRNNIFDGNVGFYLPGGLKLQYQNVDHNLYNVSSSDYYGANSINGTPYFVNPSNGDFHYLANSPAIDTGSSLYAPNIDFDGVPRPQGSNYDIGAYEYISFYDNTPPQISYISIVTSNPLDTDLNYGWENISCTVTDNTAVNAVYIKIFHPNGTEINFEMIKITGSNYYYNSTWIDYGNYSYLIKAIDTSGNTKYSNSFFFSLAPNWDINEDGSCNILDLILVSNHYNELGNNGWIREDVDNNGVVNLLDMIIVSNHYGEKWYT
jgi:hypothetical protein